MTRARRSFLANSATYARGRTTTSHTMPTCSNWFIIVAVFTFTAFLTLHWEHSRERHYKVDVDADDKDDYQELTEDKSHAIIFRNFAKSCSLSLKPFKPRRDLDEGKAKPFEPRRNLNEGKAVVAYVVDSGLSIPIGFNEDFLTIEEGISVIETKNATMRNSTVDDDDVFHGTCTVLSLVDTAKRSPIAIKRLHIVPIKVCETSGTGEMSILERAIQIVIEHRSKFFPNHLAIVVMSLNGLKRHRGLRRWVEIAVRDYNMAFVVSAGNMNTDACDVAPSNIPYVISVGSMGQIDGRLPGSRTMRQPYSNFGPCVDIFATAKSTYACPIKLQGTSISAAKTAGAFASFWSYFAFDIDARCAMQLFLTSEYVNPIGIEDLNCDRDDRISLRGSTVANSCRWTTLKTLIDY